MTKTKSDYRQAKYLTKDTLNEILSNCGECKLSEEELKETKKDQLLKRVEDAQNKVKAIHGKLFPGEY